MGFLLNTLKALVIAIIVIMASATIYKCQAYTYDGDIDPQQFFTYEFIGMEDIGGGRRILALHSSDHYPNYVLNVVVVTPMRKVMILAYCYYDKDFNFMHYQLSKRGNYVEFKLPPEVEDMLRKRLNKLHGITSVEEDKDKKKSDV